MNNIEKCPICSGASFSFQEVLWKDLIDEWGLLPEEVDYVNRQQGFSCDECGNNLRSMVLAQTIVRVCGRQGSLKDFCLDPPQGIKILEINSAGNLTCFLKDIPGHNLINFPDYDLMNLPESLSGYDLVIHSDTLEHVELPNLALSECRRVLNPGGRCLFTVPLVVGRLSRSREGLPHSHHGTCETSSNDYVVHTEFGADVWLNVFQAGFASCTFHCLEYPAAFAIEAVA